MTPSISNEPKEESTKNTAPKTKTPKTKSVEKVEAPSAKKQLIQAIAGKIVEVARISAAGKNLAKDKAGKSINWKKITEKAAKKAAKQLKKSVAESTK